MGAAGRGGTFKEALELNGARIHAVCDIREETLDACARETGAIEIFTSYERMLDESELDAVVIGTPQHLHAPQAAAALERGLHVLSEVPAAISVEQCRALVKASTVSAGIYMMAENYIYTRTNLLLRELARQGIFGELYYAEGEYLHELKDLAERTTWRRHWQMGIDGITYPTHSLGPILQWMAGDRVTRVCCEGSGQHYRDPRGEPYHQDTAVMLGKTERGGLIKLRLDLVSERPHSMSNHQLQGTTGAYESSRAPGEPDRIWLLELGSERRWHNLDQLSAPGGALEGYLPESWRNPPEAARRAGHGGGDYFEVADFLNAVRGIAPTPLGIHKSLDMTLPGLLSQESIARGGEWLNVPDSRDWIKPDPRQPQLRMTLGRDRLESPPPVNIPEGYALRTYRETDEAGYVALMARAGFAGWNRDRIAAMMQRVVPDGFSVIEHLSSGKLVATAMAVHSPHDLHPSGGEMGWVAADPNHSGRGLGLAVCAAVTGRLLRGGYRNIYLLTDDWRLPAISIYLRLGYEPLLFCEGMQQRWEAVRSALARR
ncbi:MAG: GNAT family N-acetyltransferase [Chloroflexi bacterium]|nr:GNAT family N-acetyltransferase [Chloroflexota bacterium]